MKLSKNGKTLLVKLVFIVKALKKANNYKNDYTKYVFYVAIFRKKYYSDTVRAKRKPVWSSCAAA